MPTLADLSHFAHNIQNPQTSFNVGLIQIGTFPLKVWVLMIKQLHNENIHLKNPWAALTIDRLIAICAR